MKRTIKNYELRVRRVTVADAGAHYGKKLRAPRDVSRLAQLLIGDCAQELFYAFHLDIKNRVLGFSEVARGGIDICPVDPRAVFRTAIALGSSGLIVAHCHPSGDPTPSREDIELTKRLKSASELLGIPVLDHVIVTDTGTVSLAEQGLM